MLSPSAVARSSAVAMASTIVNVTDLTAAHRPITHLLRFSCGYGGDRGRINSLPSRLGLELQCQVLAAITVYGTVNDSGPSYRHDMGCRPQIHKVTECAINIFAHKKRWVGTYNDQPPIALQPPLGPVIHVFKGGYLTKALIKCLRSGYR